jgi:hypothetical protein
MVENNNGGEWTGDNLVFIVGSPRSGTTWLQRLLATHPRVQTGQESRLFNYLGSQLRLWREDLASATVIGRSGTGLACYLTEAEFFAIQKKYLAALLKPMLRHLQPGQIFLEKTPDHALFVPEIVQLLPAAKIIHIVRDPHDVVASLLAASRTWGANWAPRKVKHALRVWHQHVDQARQAGAQLPPEQFLEIGYEDMVASPENRLRAIADFLRLAWSDADIAAAVKANAAGELRQGKGTPIPIRGALAKAPNAVVQEPKDFVRKARPGSWRQDLTWLERWQLARHLRRLERKFPGTVKK